MCGEYQVDRVHVHAEHRAVHGLDQAEVAVHAIGDHPLHHLDRIVGPARLDRIENVAHVLDGALERVLRQVARMGSHPVGRAEGTGDVDATARAQLIGQRQRIHVVGQVLRALLGVRVEHIVPRPDLGQHDIVAREGLARGPDPLWRDRSRPGRLDLLAGGRVGPRQRLRYRGHRRGRVTQLRVAAGDLLRVRARHKQRRSESHRTPPQDEPRPQVSRRPLRSVAWMHVTSPARRSAP